MALLQVRDLTFTYPECTAPALEKISLSLNAGEFVVLAGSSGCGKSTLLRQCKPLLSPFGEREGELLFQGKSLPDLSQREQTENIGFVLQAPEQQIVTDKVWHELAFAMESLGYDNAAIRRRVAEMADFFGIQSWFHQEVQALSGGQKQLLNLAAVMTLSPKLLLLDEPTSMLDPIAATEFLTALSRINRELGVTVLISEHRLEDVLPLADRLLVLDKGRLILDAPPTQGEIILDPKQDLYYSLPTTMRIWDACGRKGPCPLTVREGRAWLQNALTQPNQPISTPKPPSAASKKGEATVEMEEVWFRYAQNSPDVLRGLSMQAYAGELLCFLGSNGAGKTTALSLLSQGNLPQHGKIRCQGKVAVLPQDPQTLFRKKTVFLELADAFGDMHLTKTEKESQVLQMANLCGLTPLLERHPYDLSGGEQQRTALAKVLLTRPDILLLDEPTKGLDGAFKRTFAGILQSLKRNGVTLIMVSHDVEFCAQYGDRCVFLFDGEMVAEGVPREFFPLNSFYTTIANRISRGLLDNCVLGEDIMQALGGVLPPPLPEVDWNAENQWFQGPKPIPKPKNPDKLPLWRRILAWVAGLTAIGCAWYALRGVNLSQIITAENVAFQGETYPYVYGLLLLSLLVLALAVNRKRERIPIPKPQKQPLSRRTWVSLLLVAVAAPLTVLAGYFLFADRRYFFISLLLVFETMLPFALVFEGRKPQARELVLIAVLCALAVGGRMIFFMLPGFKPVLALVILAGVAFGGETGFLVGAVTMFVSNMFFGQGPWTPWQMFTTGLIGLLAGILFCRGLLQRSRLSLTIFGALATVVIYGGIMNPATVLMYQNNPTWQMVLAAYITGFPMDLVHGAATAFFLWFLTDPMLEKFDRIKSKYGLIPVPAWKKETEKPVS